MRARQSKLVSSDYSIPKEFFLMDDDHSTDSLPTPTKSPNLWSSDMALKSMPSFDLLEEGAGEDLFTSEPAEITSQSTSRPGESETRCKKTTDTIVDHIRKKSKNFPTLVTSRGMDPLILTRKSTRNNQSTVDGSENCQEDLIVLTDSEPAEASSPMLIGQNDDVSSRSSGSVISSEHEAAELSLARNNVSTSEDDTMIDGAQAVDCKKPPRNHLDVSYLGFRSVFSFL